MLRNFSVASVIFAINLSPLEQADANISKPPISYFGGGHVGHNPLPPNISIVPVVSQQVTDKVQKIILDGADTCQRLGVEYRADCLRQVFRAASSEMSPFSDYDPASRELNRAIRQINRLVRGNVDPNLPTVRALGANIRPLASQSIGAVNSQVEQIITETSTRLLRSTGRENLVSHFSQVSVAVNSTKVILRS